MNNQMQMRKTNHSYKSSKTNKKREKNNFYGFEPLDEENQEINMQAPYDEADLEQNIKPILPTDAKKKRRNHSQENHSAEQEYDSQEDKESYTDDWYDETKDKKK